MDPIYVYVPNDLESRFGPQPLSAYEHALLEYRNASIERQLSDKNGVRLCAACRQNYWW